MEYEHEKKIRSWVELELFRYGHHLPEYDAEVTKELEEVYAKAKILNKIIDIVKTGRSLEDFGDVEVTLLAIEHELNYMLEDK